jgi:hypothetical protein
MPTISKFTTLNPKTVCQPNQLNENGSRHRRNFSLNADISKVSMPLD